MTCYRCILFAVVITTLLIVKTDGEIHRTKSTTSKTLSKSKVHSRNSDVAERSGDNSNMLESERSLTVIWGYSLLGSVLVGLSGIFPLLVIPLEAGPSLKHGAASARLKLLLSFAVGGLLGDVFLHLLPEAWEHLDKDGVHDHGGHMAVGMWVLFGIISFLIIEKLFAKEGEFEHLPDECEDEEEEDNDTELMYKQKRESVTEAETTEKTQEDSVRLRKTNNKKDVNNGKIVENGHKDKVLNTNDKKQKQNTVEKNKNGNGQQSSIRVSGYLNLMANVIDNFTHGLAVAGSFLVSNKVGFITTLAILLHEVPHEVGDFAILLRSGFDRWKAAKAQLLTATGGMIGVITALTAESAKAAGDRTAWILPFTSGGFIYIALVTVVPDLLDERHGRESIKQIFFLCLGIAAMVIVTLIH